MLPILRGEQSITLREAGVVRPRRDFAEFLTERGVPFIDWEGWSRIDARERALGAAEGRERVKISPLPDLLDAAR